MQEIRKLVALIGAPKAGTSSLYHHIARHPKVAAGRIKEPRFFTRWSERQWRGPGVERFLRPMLQDVDSYRANFEGLAPDKWALDGSTDYLWCPESLEMLSAFGDHCDLRLICVLRDPVERAVSEYNQTLRSNWQSLSFTKALAAEQERMKAGWQPVFFHKRRSTVAADVRRYADRFGDRLLVIDYADLSDTPALMRRIWDFLGIEDTPTEQMSRRNEAFVPRSGAAGAMLRSKGLKRLGRNLLPQRVRRFIWDSLHANARDVVTVTPEERAHFSALLAEEIDTCIADPLIPTDKWTCGRYQSYRGFLARRVPWLWGGGPRKADGRPSGQS